MPKSGEWKLAAVKKMNKQYLLEKNQFSHIKAERDIMSVSKSKWIV